MLKYIIRLDDACPNMNKKNWDMIEKILDRYNIKPIVGIIPHNKDKSLDRNPADKNFWGRAIEWQKKGWIIAMHGYQHIYETIDGGINPVQNRSEFAGLSYEKQKEKLLRGYALLISRKLKPLVFFAPSHTFDNNTIEALKKATDICVVSDTIANNVYYEKGLFFIPQQAGYVRNLPFKVTTFCYHPNEMEYNDFVKLDKFISNHKKHFIFSIDDILKKRKINKYDKFLRFLYFLKRKINN